MMALGIMHFHQTVVFHWFCSRKENLLNDSILSTSVLDHVVTEIISVLDSQYDGKTRPRSNDNKTTVQSSVAEWIIKNAKTKISAKGAITESSST